MMHGDQECVPVLMFQDVKEYFHEDVFSVLIKGHSAHSFEYCIFHMVMVAPKPSWETHIVIKIGRRF
jgi:hypothetical protein